MATVAHLQLILDMVHDGQDPRGNHPEQVPECINKGWIRELPQTESYELNQPSPRYEDLPRALELTDAGEQKRNSLGSVPVKKQARPVTLKG